MEEANMKSSWKEEEVMLPGFRFHPTDEELISFYLRQKVEKKPISIEIIKQIDIYKYDPWDLPKEASNGGEWYFFCKRGRKYRNSIRPNRVTGSGFWKATGIDKPIYAAQQPHHRIGLKKSLVYYFGSAGKGTKTDWMMHEFRLPPNGKDALANVKVEHIALEAEVWTLCRIFKRNPSNKKYTSPAAWKNATSTRKHNDWGSSGWRTSSCSLDNGYTNKKCTSTLCDSDSVLQLNNSKPNTNTMEQMDGRNHHFWTDSISAQQAQIAASGDSTASSCGPNGDVDVFRNGNWDELGHVVELALEHSPCF